MREFEREIKGLPFKLIFSNEIRRVTGYNIRWLYDLEKRGEFPKRLKMGGRRIAWNAEEVFEWQQSRQRACARKQQR